MTGLVLPFIHWFTDVLYCQSVSPLHYMCREVENLGDACKRPMPIQVLFNQLLLSLNQRTVRQHTHKVIRGQFLSSQPLKG